ncbi:MAG: ABC transporter permease, partial [Chrysiogenetes bacterium]|nr:ABC transporter permease [Chrysiogenetes bacterium]
MIKLSNVSKQYRMGSHVVHALREVSFEIERGDFVAIMGASGSGKSTLMHLLGLLDVPDLGSYVIEGREIANMNDEDLSALRGRVFGFVFQQFNLIPRLSAVENVALPMIYTAAHRDLSRAAELLDHVGLGDRLDHHPNELSGGQQQRVAIARSLINRPLVLLADEPTGNLDSASEREILDTLRRLNEQGITVIIVTHEEEVGAQTKRLIRMKDGEIVSDERLEPLPAIPAEPEKPVVGEVAGHSLLGGVFAYLSQGLSMLMANKVRSGLSVLGILIGVAAVVATLALGRGARQSIEQQMSALGSNLLVLRSGAVRVAGVTQQAGTVSRLTVEDSVAIGESVPHVLGVCPSINDRVQATYEGRNWNTRVIGATPSYEWMRNARPTIGRFFTEEENRLRARVAVVGVALVRELFGGRNPVGKYFKINKVNFQIIGVLPEKGFATWWDQDDVAIVPILTTMDRVTGKDYVESIEIQIDHASNIGWVQGAVEELMYSRHRVPASQREGAFRIQNLGDVQSAMEESNRTMSLLLAAIAAVSLLVGGIGIMNIMLVSVAERTREIGLRKAVGARGGDIMVQFLAESVVVSVAGGLCGIALGWAVSEGFSRFAGWV